MRHEQVRADGVANCYRKGVPTFRDIALRGGYPEKSCHDFGSDSSLGVGLAQMDKVELRDCSDSLMTPIS